MTRFLLSAFLLCFVASTAQSQTAEDLLQQALRLERSQGDYAGAIALYQRAAAEPDTDRRITGRALIQLAKAYENLGRSEAARTYQRVLADYADMPDLAAEARQGFARTREPVSADDARPAPMSRTPVTITDPSRLGSYGASLSPTGRFLTGAAWRTPAGMTLVELSTGEESFIALNGFAEFPRLSPDEKQIAVEVFPKDISFGSVIIMDRGSQKQRVLFDVAAYFREHGAITLEKGGSEVLDWSRDGKQLLVRAYGTVLDNGPVSVYLGYLLLPVDGSPPRLLDTSQDVTPPYFGLNEENGCISADGRFVFADYLLFPGGWDGRSNYNALERRQIIRRFDTATGEVSDWRNSAGTDYSLWSCTWDTNSIVYSTNPLGDTVVRVASPSDDEPTDDAQLARFPGKAFTITGSKVGDIAMESSERAGLFEFDLDPDTGRLLGKARQIDEGNTQLGTWSRDSERLAWSRFREGGVLVVRNADSGSSQTFSEISFAFGLRWESDDILGFSKYNPATDSTWTTRFDRYRFHIGERAVTDSISAAFFSTRGLSPGGDPDFGWSAERGCLMRVDRATGEQAEFLCNQAGWVGRLFTRPSQDGTRYLVQGTPAKGRMSFGAVERDGTGYRELLREDTGDRYCYGDWGRPTEVIIGCRPTGGSSFAYRRLNVDTGNLTDAFREVSELIDIRQLALSPDGRRLAVAGSPRSGDSAEVTVIHNVVERK